MQNASALPVKDADVVTGPWKVSTEKGSIDTRLSSQWYNRPDDQRFLSLDDLHAATLQMYQQSSQSIIDVKDVRVLAEQDNPDDLRLLIPGTNRPDFEAKPTHWSFGQMCSLLAVPAGYLRKLPAPIAGINMQYALATFRQENIKAYTRENGSTELRAATGPEYGRVPDHEVVQAVRRIAGNGRGDTHWKIPGVMDWGTMLYDPKADVTRGSTTLFASDRDVFMFLCDDTHPIEVGKLQDGSPDYLIRGFYVWNSEVGSKTLGVATMYFRAACQNRILWGVEGYQEITLRHSKGAPAKFAGEVGPALESFANNGTGKLLTGIKAAQSAIVSKSETDSVEWLQKQGFTKVESRDVIAAVFREEAKPARSVWDFVQGITAVARNIPHADDRVTMERRAGKLLDKVAS